VLIEGKDLGQAVLPHEHERNALGKTHLLIGELAEEVHGCLFVLRVWAQAGQGLGVQQVLRPGRRELIGGPPRQ